MSAFEQFAAPEALGPADRVECGVCWTVYDPAQGDPVWQIEAGTPFSALPDEWRCPHCDAPKERFMRLDHGG